MTRLQTGLYPLVALCLSMALATSTHAQSQNLGPKERFAQGVRAFEAGSYEEALSAFRAAYRAKPHPAVLINMAHCHLKMDQPVEAIEHFQQYLEETASNLSAAERGEIDTALAEARAAVAKVEIEAPDFTTVSVDGAPAGRTPLPKPLVVNPGSHVVELRTEAGGVRVERLSLSSGETFVLRGEFAPSAAGPRQSPPEGWQDASSESPPLWGDEPAPQADESSGSGTHRLLGLPVATWVLGGVAVAALGAGIGFGLTALSQKDDYDAVLTDIQRLPRGDPNAMFLTENAEAIDDARSRNAAVADVLFVASAAAAGGALLFYLLDEEDGDEPALAIRANPFGGTLRGRF